MSSITETTANQDFYQVFMEPPRNALKMREFLHQACVLSQDEDFAKQHFVSSGYALLAWAVSFFENFKCAGKCLENCVIDIWHMDISQVLEQLSENGIDFVHSMKYTLVMPFIIFAGLFMPDPVYTSLDFPRYYVLGRAPEGTEDREHVNREENTQQIEENYAEQIRLGQERIIQLEERQHELVEERNYFQEQLVVHGAGIIQNGLIPNAQNLQNQFDALQAENAQLVEDLADQIDARAQFVIERDEIGRAHV